MAFDPEKYLETLSLNGGSTRELTPSESKQVFEVLYSRMGREPEKEKQDGTA